MTGTAAHLDPAKCHQYAQFAAHLDRYHFKIIYWFLFLLVLSMLFLSSWYWTKCNDAVEKYSANSVEHRRRMRRCLVVCFICLLTAVVASVMEVYALMALQFCDGEDLMSLYWSTWTTLQLTSIIGIAGIFLSVVHSYRGRKHPPWSLALGTPITVIAGFAHLIQHALKRRIQKKKRLEKDTLSMRAATTQNTLVDDNHVTDSEDDRHGRIVGFGPDGGPILLLEETPTFIPFSATILGKNNEGKFIIAYKRDSAQFELRDARAHATGPRRDADRIEREADRIEREADRIEKEADRIEKEADRIEKDAERKECQPGGCDSKV